MEDELGMEVKELEIARNGDISVQFGDGYTKDKEALAISICEARIGSVLEPGGVSVLGPPKNLGRRGSDAELDALLRERARMGFQGASLAEFEGQPRFSVGFGTLAPASAQTPDDNTAFDCGSILKLVTAATVFLLEETRQLSRDEPLADFFGQLPNGWGSVTIDQTLTHTAGFSEYHDTQGDFESMDRSTALDTIFAQSPRFEPGTGYAYSNSGYSVLAALIETVTGEDYRSAVRHRVFEPLAMTRSGFYGDGLWDDGNVATGSGTTSFLSNDPAHWPPPTWALMGNGGLVSTLGDLLKLSKSFDGGALFAPATREAFEEEYLARTTGRIGGKTVIGYAGGNDFGFDAVVLQVPEDSTYVVAASHVLSPVTAEILAVEALQVLYGEVLEQPNSP